MKKSEVPQDNENMLQGKMRELQYAIDENGNYTTVKSVGWEPKNIIFKDTLADLQNKIDQAREEVVNGEFSPIYFHMVKNQMNLSLLSKYVGLCRFRVRKHLKKNNYSKLTIRLKDKYVKAFNYKNIINLEELV